MSYPLKDNFVSGQALAALPADWLNTVARVLNTFEIVDGYVERSPDGRNWKLHKDLPLDLAAATPEQMWDIIDVDRATNDLRLSPGIVNINEYNKTKKVFVDGRDDTVTLSNGGNWVYLNCDDIYDATPTITIEVTGSSSDVWVTGLNSPGWHEMLYYINWDDAGKQIRAATQYHNGAIDIDLTRVDDASLERSETLGVAFVQQYEWDSPNIQAPDSNDLITYKDVTEGKQAYFEFSVINDMIDSAFDDTSRFGAGTASSTAGSTQFWVQGGDKSTCWGSQVGDNLNVACIELAIRQLVASDGITPTLDWQSQKLTSGTDTRADWNLCKLQDTVGRVAVNWNTKELTAWDSEGWLVTDTLGSSAKTEGAFRVLGGVGVGENLYATHVGAEGYSWVSGAVDADGYTDTSTVWVIGDENGNSKRFKIVGGLWCDTSEL